MAVAVHFPALMTDAHVWETGRRREAMAHGWGLVSIRISWASCEELWLALDSLLMCPYFISMQAKDAYPTAARP